MGVTVILEVALEKPFLGFLFSGEVDLYIMAFSRWRTEEGIKRGLEADKSSKALIWPMGQVNGLCGFA